MNRRDFLQSAGAVGAAAAIASHAETARAEGYRRCEQIHDKLTLEDIDRWSVELPVPAEIATRVLAPGNMPAPKIGGVRQGVAPEFRWTSEFNAIAESPHSDLAAGDAQPRPADI